MLDIKKLPPKVRGYLEDLTASTDKDFKYLKAVKDTMNKVFGEERNSIERPELDNILKELWSIGYRESDLSKLEDVKRAVEMRQLCRYKCMIHFPEIKITNSKKKSHIIRDLYVRFWLDENGKMDYRLEGIRTTLTPGEMSAQYAHSHLPRFGTIPQWSSFCRGSGEINQVMSLLSSTFTEVNFTLFCLHLKNYVAWESLEGNPYNYIENINLTRPVQSIATSTVNLLVERLQKEVFGVKGTDEWIKKNLTIKVSSRGIVVGVSDKFERWAAEYISSVGYGTYNAAKSTTGMYYSINHGRSTTRATLPAYAAFKFKKENIFYKLLTDTNQEDERDICIHPEVREEFCRRIGYSFTKEALKNQSNSSKESTPTDLPQVTESDLLPL